MTWVEVVDSAVKIGLGALVAGIFAFRVAKLNAQSEVQKLKFEKRSELLSGSAAQYEEFFQAFLKFSNLLVGLAKAVADPPKDPIDAEIHTALMVDQATNATNLRMAMKNRMEESFQAQSKLLLLGEKECSEKAAALHTALMHADRSYKFDGDQFTLEKYTETLNAVRVARNEFYEAMSEALNLKADQGK